MFMRTFLVVLLLLNAVSSQAQEVIKADNLRQSNGRIIIDYEMRGTSSCFNVISVLVMIKSSNYRLTAKSITGDLKDVKTGKRQIVWDYKADNFYAEGEVEVNIQIEPCASSKSAPVKQPDITTDLPRVRATAPHPIALKIRVAGLGIAAGAGAYLIRNDFITKQNKLNTLNTTLPQINGDLVTQADKNTWDIAYKDVLAAKKATLFNALAGVAALSAGYEAYLLLTKRKLNKRVSLTPSSQNLGATLTLNF